MLGKEELKKQIRKLGIQSVDTVLLHTSLRSLGPVEGGADGLIEAFQEVLTEGLLLIPTHTWATVNQPPHVYDVRKTPACIGTLPSVAAFRADGIRSLHPTHSMWAWGKDAAAFVAGEELLETPASPGGAWSRLTQRNAKILLIGVGLDKNTFIHAVEEEAQIPDRLREEPYTITVIDREGTGRVHPYYRHFCSRCKDVSVNYTNFEKPLIHHGAMSFGTLGDATVRIVDASACRNVLLNIFTKAEMDLSIEKMEIPDRYYK